MQLAQFVAELFEKLLLLSLVHSPFLFWEHLCMPQIQLDNGVMCHGGGGHSLLCHFPEIPQPASKKWMSSVSWLFSRTMMNSQCDSPLKLSRQVPGLGGSLLTFPVCCDTWKQCRHKSNHCGHHNRLTNGISENFSHIKLFKSFFNVLNHFKSFFSNSRSSKLLILNCRHGGITF